MTHHDAIAASGHPLVSEAAIEILKQGGNAFDAAISAGFVSSVVEPALTSLGGGGFFMAHTRDGKSKIFDFFSDTPGKGLSENNLEPHFFPVTVSFSGSDQDFNIGLGSVAVPGTLKGFLHVHQTLGSLPLHQIVQPAIHAASDGVHLLEQQAHFLELLEPILTMTSEGKKLFCPNGHYLSYGDLLKNSDIADFLQNLVFDGTTYYDGKLARQIEQDMKKGQGLLTGEDLSQYRVIERFPVSSSYRGYTFQTNPPPSFGGSLISMALRELEKFQLDFNSHLSSDYICAHAKVMLAVEKNRHLVHQNNDDGEQKIFSRGTTHLSVVDSFGNAASMTNSNGEGSGYIIPGTGIMLNNMMGEDDLHPDGFHKNPAGLRVSSMMSPSLLLDGDKVVLVIGSGGSKRIRTAITQVISLIVDCGLGIQDAINFPRIHWDGEFFQVEPGFPPESLNALRKLGLVNEWTEKNVYFGGVHGVMPGIGGGSDPRRGGAVREL